LSRAVSFILVLDASPMIVGLFMASERASERGSPLCPPRDFHVANGRRVLAFTVRFCGFARRA